MKDGVKQAFKDACTEYLATRDLNNLRAYGREIGVSRPTDKQKRDLIAEIVGVLAGEIPPIERAKRGAPVKDDSVDLKIVETIRLLKEKFAVVGGDDSSKREEKLDLGLLAKAFAWKSGEAVLYVAEEDKERTYTGQVKTYEGVACLLPLSFDLSKGKIVLPVELIRKYDLRDGDVIECHVDGRNSVVYVREVLTVNGAISGALSRVKYEEAAVSLPAEKIAFFDGEVTSVEGKCLDWLLPVGKGQRSLIVGAPKTGKTRFLLDALKSLKKEGLETLVLLVDQAPEVVYEYQKFLSKNQLVATSYEDDAQKHLLAAEFLLARAKRLAESGKDVLLAVDGLNALATAYDEQDETGKLLPCGLTAATLHYVKKYFASAKRLEKKGSLTMMATLSVGTGAPADEGLETTLVPVANHTVALDNGLAMKRVYPALDFVKCRTEYLSAMLSAWNAGAESLYRTKIQALAPPDFLVGALTAARTYDDFYSLIDKAAKKLGK